MQTPNTPKKAPAKPEDANAKKDLPTASHIAARENAEFPPSDETMTSQPGPRLQPVEGSVGQKVDTNTMSDQPDSFRGKK